MQTRTEKNDLPLCQFGPGGSYVAVWPRQCKVLACKPAEPNPAEPNLAELAELA